MKCFTLKADRQILFGSAMLMPMSMPLTMIAPELYPSPVEGFRVHRQAEELFLAPGFSLKISPELMAQAQTAVDDPECVIIERASLERSASGTLTLLPEKAGDNEAALVNLDLGRGAYSSVRYEVGNRVVLRARQNADILFGTEELALVEVPTGRPFAAFRSRSRFLCFGGEVIGEQLQVKFDGTTLSCEPVRADK